LVTGYGPTISVSNGKVSPQVTPLLASRFLPRRYQLIYAISVLFPKLRKSMRVVRFDFSS
jgi:hypothetical protein